MGTVRIDPLYYLDEMSQDEVSAIYKAKEDSKRDSWEQTRLLCFYSLVAQQGTKHIKQPKDLFPLAWDEGKSEEVKGNNLTKEQFLSKVKYIK